MDTFLRLLAVAGLIAGNAFFVIAEYALVTARRSALERRAREGSRGARVALRLMGDPVRVISTVQIAITGLGVLLGAVGQPAIEDLVGTAVPAWAAFAIGFAVVTYLSVAFGELVPKALALHTAERFAVAVAVPIELTGRAFRPGVWILERSAALVLRPLGVPAVIAGEGPLTREELRGMVQDAEQRGTLRAHEEDMLVGVIDLRGREARDIMVPWSRVQTVDLSAPAHEIVDRVLDAPYSRYPALREQGGPVVGVLHARDVWDAVRRDPDADVSRLVRAPVIVPPTLRVDRMMRDLRRARQHLAVVLDEYGGPLGIATLEDAIEEIVGEIEDEFDRPSLRVRRVAEKEYVADAGVSLSDFNRATGAGLRTERAHSLGGLILDELGRAPKRGDAVSVDSARLLVEAVDDHRITRVRVTLTDGDVADAGDHPPLVPDAAPGRDRPPPREGGRRPAADSAPAGGPRRPD